MMTEHLTERTIELYRRRKIDPAERQKTDSHLGMCDDCLKRVLDPSDSTLAFNSLKEAFLPAVGEQPFHLSHTELKSYSAGVAPQADQIICESHIETCDSCRKELHQLSAVYDSDTAKTGVRSLRLWPAWGSFKPARVAVALALFGLLVFAIVLWRQRSSSSTINETARNGPRDTPGAAASPVPSNETTPDSAEQVKPSNQTMPAGLKDNDREIRLDQEGKLIGMEGFDETSQRMARAALTGEVLSKPNVLDSMSSPPIKLLGERADESVFQLIGPLGKVISAQRPTLRWQRLSGATSYVVSVFDENFNRVVQSSTLSQPAWTVAVPLPRGRTYSWEVTAVKDGKEITTPVAPAPRAQFRILEGEKLSVLTKMKGQKPGSHLALGLMYARFALVSDAEREFRQLVKENPDSALAKKLLRTVHAWQK